EAGDAISSVTQVPEVRLPKAFSATSAFLNGAMTRSPDASIESSAGLSSAASGSQRHRATSVNAMLRIVQISQVTAPNYNVLSSFAIRLSTHDSTIVSEPTAGSDSPMMRYTRRRVIF